MLNITRHGIRIWAEYCDEERSHPFHFRADAALQQWGPALDAEGWPLEEGELGMLLEVVWGVALRLILNRLGDWVSREATG